MSAAMKRLRMFFLRLVQALGKVFTANVPTARPHGAGNPRADGLMIL